MDCFPGPGFPCREFSFKDMTITDLGRMDLKAVMALECTLARGDSTSKAIITDGGRLDALEGEIELAEEL
jgi:hypothetical protein